MKRLFLFCLALLCAGCALFQTRVEDFTDPIVRSNYRAVDRMLQAPAVGQTLNKRRPIVVASLVNIDDLNSSRLGRMLSEQLATRLTQNGYQVVELKMRDSIFVKQSQGELLLSREIKDITLTHQAQAVLVGTYAIANGRVYITVKLVGVKDNTAIAAEDYVLPMDSNVRSLLWVTSNR